MRVIVILALVVLGAVSTARAQSGGAEEPDVEREVPYIAPPEAREEPAPRRKWYGWEILLADTVMAPVTPMISSDIENDTLRMVVGLGPLLVTAPLVHLLHGQHDRALKSLAWRAAPIAAFVVVDALHEDGGDGGPSGFTIGAAMLGAVYVASYYVWEIGWNSSVVEAPRQGRDGSWTFGAAPTAGGATFAVAGSF